MRESLNGQKIWHKEKWRTARRAPGDNVLPDEFQTVAVILPSDWAEKHKSFLAPKRYWPFETGLVRHCPQGLFSLCFTFVHAIFFSPFRLTLSPTLCPWVSEDATESELEESECFHLFPTPLTCRLRSCENRIIVVGSRSGRINQTQCAFPRFVIRLVLLLLLATLTT